MTRLTERQGAAFARVALANIAREYPRRIDHLLLQAPGDLAPRRVHPVFYGSYDWHSAVHMHWLLVRLLRLHPRSAHAGAIEAALDVRLTPEAIAREREYFESPAGRTFERPYGWAWLLELQAELLRSARESWSNAVSPLAALLAGRLGAHFANSPYPVRTGSHGNTAFAALLALDYAGSAADKALAAGIAHAAERWYDADRAAPLAFEPSLDDFLSPALVEAVLMREVLPRERFARWIETFLPRDLGPLERLPSVTDRADPKQSHLDGLALSRAWCFRRLATTWPRASVRRTRCEAAAERHLAAALPRAVGGEYVSEHWLASFAALAVGQCP